MRRLPTRIAFVLAASLAAVALHGHHHAAFAKGDDDGGDDDEDSGDGGKGDKGDSGDDGEDGDEVDKTQPPVTAGGLFTLQTYPERETLRPLTMTQGITQVRLAIGTDLSAKGAFASIGVNLEALYGLSDNFMLVGGIQTAYNANQFSGYVGFEGALAYDIVDFRLAANLHRFAVPRFCGNDAQAPVTCTSDTAALPSGNYDAAGAQFSLDLGFPFRYAIRPEIAFVALQTLISIDFNGQQRGDPTKRAAGLPVYCTGVNADMTDSMGNPTLADPKNCIENGAKPDLNPSIGFSTNPIAALSIVVLAQLRIPDFDTSAGNFQVPVTARVEFSPMSTLDLGLEFVLLNVTPPAPQSPIDNRFLSLYAQARF